MKRKRNIIILLLLILAIIMILHVFFIADKDNNTGKNDVADEEIQDDKAESAEASEDSDSEAYNYDAKSTGKSGKTRTGKNKSKKDKSDSEDYDSSKSPEEIVKSMTLEQKIGQMIMPAFRTWSSGDQTSNVTQINDEITDAVSELGLGGVILFAENIGETEQTVRLINDFQTAATSEDSLSKIPLLISTDQEGGSVCRLKCGTCLCGNMALAAGGSLDDTAAAAGIIRTELKALGINVDFSPVMDINNNPNNPIIGVRSFSDDPAIVSKYGSAFIKALQSDSKSGGNVGVACALKHFPGHGDTSTDSHTGLPSVDKTYSEIEDFELSTFQSGIDAGADMIMTAHIQYPKIEKKTYISKKDGKEITLPATLSKTIITDILRTDMGYDGVVSTDALNMSAIADHFDSQDTACLAINAGVDILLMPVTVTDSNGINELDSYIDGIADQVRAGKISEERITESALRILKLKEKRGILKTSTNNVDKKVTAAESVVGCDGHHDKEMEITLRTITLLKNDKDESENATLPFSGEEGMTTAVFCPYSNEVAPFKDGADRLVAAGKLKDSSQVNVYCYSECNPNSSGSVSLYNEAEEFVYSEELANADQIAVSVESGSTAALTGWQAAFTDALITEAHKAGKKVLFISTQLPYDAARYQAADAIILSYNPKGTMGETSGPSFAASLMIAYGYQKPTGKLPVDVPKLNENYEYTDEVLYSRGTGMTDF